MGQKRPETGLLEVPIGREGFPQIVVSHNDKRDAISQGPVLVRPLSIQLDALDEQRVVGGNHGRVSIRFDRLEETHTPATAR